MSPESYIWQCCDCHGPWNSAAIEDHCCWCFRRRCKRCDTIAVKDDRGDSYLSNCSVTDDAQIQLKDRQTDLEQESPKSSSSAPSEFNDLLVCRLTNTRPNSAHEPPASSWSSPRIDQKRSVEPRSFVASSSMDSPNEPVVADDNPEGESLSPASDTSISTDSDFKKHEQYSSSSGHSQSTEVKATVAGIPEPVSHPSWLDSLLDHPRYPIVVKAWAEFQSKDLVDEGGSSTNTQESIPSSSSSTSYGGCDKRSLEGGKRKRESSKKDESGNAKKVKHSGSDDCPGASQDKRRLACHFYKMNPRQYSGCMRKSWDPIGHVKQHLQDDHKLGPNHCKSCWSSFTDEDELRQHECIPTGGKSVDQLQRIPRGLDGPRAQWYWIWDQLFPNFPHPKTPYYTDDPADPLFQQFFNFLIDQYPPLSSMAETLWAAWSSTPAYALNTRQLPTPATTVSDGEMRTSPPEFQMLSGNDDTHSNTQPPATLINRSDEGIAFLESLSGGDLRYTSQLLTEAPNFQQGVDVPSAHNDGYDTTNDNTTYTGYGLGANFIDTEPGEEYLRRWTPEQDLIAGPSDGTIYHQWAFSDFMRERNPVEMMDNVDVGAAPELWTEKDEYISLDDESDWESDDESDAED